MPRHLCTVALTLSVAPIVSVLAAPHGCEGARWGWPGYVMCNDPWGVVLAPSKFASQGNGLRNVCISPSPSSASSTFAAPAVTSFSSISVTPGLAASVSSSSFANASTSVEIFTASNSTTSSFAPSSTSSSSSSESLLTTSTTISTTSTGSIEAPETTSFETSSSTAAPSPSSSSSEAPAPAPEQTTSSASTNSLSTNTDNGDSNDGGSNGSRVSDDDVNEFLSTHNSVRAQHGASALAWNNTLAAAAQKWSDGCDFKHSGASVGPFGENLAAGTGNYGITNAVSAWTGEVSEYNPSSPSASHFTQVVWKGSTQLGCAETSCAGGTIFGDASKYIVCEYSPQGNIIGAFAINVQA